MNELAPPEFGAVSGTAPAGAPPEHRAPEAPPSAWDDRAPTMEAWERQALAQRRQAERRSGTDRRAPSLDRYDRALADEQPASELIGNPETVTVPDLTQATEAAIEAKQAYRAAEAQVIRALIADGLVPQLPGELPRDFNRRVRQTAQQWLTMHEEERDWSSGL